MNHVRLKPYVLPSALSIIIIGIIAISLIVNQNLSPSEEPVEEVNYVSSSILSNDIPVISTEKKMINPYSDASVTIGKSYYDYKADEKSQEKSIIYHNDTYLQNSGVDYISQNTFDVMAVLNGTVTDVKDDEILGKIVQIKHDNDYISIYQSLSETSLKKGDSVTQGQVIGKSGTNELDKEIGNHLHFELYINGQIVNPSLYLDKVLQDTNMKSE